MAKAEGVADIMHLLADATRLRIILTLADGEMNVTALCDRFKCRQPLISHHLGILRRVRMVTDRRAGKEVFYRLGGRARFESPGVFDFSSDGVRVRLKSDVM